jgi:hypothetical protein
MSEIFCEEVKRRRWWQAWGVWIFAAVLLATVVGSLMYASQGTPYPTEARATESHAVVVANSAIIVFREGLEAVLILAAVMAPMLGVQKGLRRPVAARRLRSPPPSERGASRKRCWRSSRGTATASRP